MKKYRDNICIRIIAIAFASFFLYTAFFGTFEPSIHRSVHLVFTIVLGFLLYRPFPGKAEKSVYNVVDAVLSSGSLIIFGYFLLNQEILTNWIVFVTPFETKDFIISIIATTLALELGRRATGNALPIVAVIFLLYGRFGQYFPGTLYHNGYSWKKLWNSPIMVLTGYSDFQLPYRQPLLSFLLFSDVFLSWPVVVMP